MTEKEKMLAGLEYFPGDPELNKESVDCKILCHEYNQKTMTDIKKIIPNSVKGTNIIPYFWCDYGYNIYLGDYVFMNYNCVILDCAPVRFGNEVMVGPNCSFYTALHPFDPDKRRTGVEYAKPINIGNDVWFGGNVTVLPGVNIGNNVIIGAGSVVTKDIPDNMIAAGNPCRILRENKPENNEGEA